MELEKNPLCAFCRGRLSNHESCCKYYKNDIQKDIQEGIENGIDSNAVTPELQFTLTVGQIITSEMSDKIKLNCIKALYKEWLESTGEN